MPIGNSLIVIRSLHGPILYDVSFFTDTYKYFLNSLYVDYNITTGIDKIYTVADNNISYIITNKISKNAFFVKQTSPKGNALAYNYDPYSCVKDYNNNLFVVEYGNNNIKKFDSFDIETNSVFGSVPTVKAYDNTRTGWFYRPKKIAVDSNNNLYVSDENHVIRKIVYDKTNITTPIKMSTLAGPPPTGGVAYVNTIKGSTDGKNIDARFNLPHGIAIDLDDNIYVADRGNHTIRKITLDGNVTTIAGKAGAGAYVDGMGSIARFNDPTSLCCDFDNNIYVVDAGNKRIRKISKVQLTTPSGTFTQLGQDIDGEAANDQSGISVSMNSVGDRVAIGAYNNDGNGSNSGSTRIYSLVDSAWTQLGQDIDGEAIGDYSGISVSMNAVGDRVAIGAYSNDGNNSQSGSTRIYSLVGSTWTQLGQDIDGEAANDYSGYSVSMNAVGDRVAIGAYGNDGNGTDSGSTRIYSLVGSTWTKLGQDIDGEAINDYSGISVSMNAVGDRVAIGAYGNDGNGADSGSTRIYSLVGSTWTQLGQDIDGESSVDYFGYSVSMNAVGDRVAIGAYGNDGNNNSSGSTRIYSLVGSTWTQLGQDIDGEAANDQSGISVSMNAVGDRVAIGAYGNDGNGSDSGSTRIYSLVDSTWVKIGQDINGENSGDKFGWSVSMNSVGDRVAIGAYGNDGISKLDSGSVRVYGDNVEYVDYNVTTLAGIRTNPNDTEGGYFDVTFTELGDIAMMHDGNLLVIDNVEKTTGTITTSAHRIKKIKNTTGYKKTFDITLSSNRSNLVLEDLLYRRGWDGTSPVTCNLTILSGVYVYSDNIPNRSILPKPALTVGSILDNGSTITIINSGGIIGAGGNPSRGTTNVAGTTNGSDAMYIRSNITLKNYGLIGGGGGGGGSWQSGNIPDAAGGGGGAGLVAGFGKTLTTAPFNTKGGSNGSLLSGGNAATFTFYNKNTNPFPTTFTYVGGAGGGLGQNSIVGTAKKVTFDITTVYDNIVDGTNAGGQGSVYYAGGVAGKAIDGISYVTIDPSSTGSLSGATIN